MKKQSFAIICYLLVAFISGCGGGGGGTSVTPTQSSETGTVDGYAYIPVGAARYAPDILSAVRMASRAAAAPPAGYVMLAGATVVCGEKTTTTDTSGYYTITGVSVGNQTVSISKEGYGTITVAVTVAANATVTVPQASSVLTPAQSGSITVSSSPSGATIFIDGADSGFTTPKTFNSVSVASHQVYVTLTGYDAPAAQTKSVSNGQTTTFEFTLTPTGQPLAVQTSVSPTSGTTSDTFTVTCEISGGTPTLLEGRCDTSDTWHIITSGNTLDCSYSATGTFTPGCRVNGSTSDDADAPVTVTALITWVKTFGGTMDDKAIFTQLMNDGGYIIAGNRSSIWTESTNFLTQATMLFFVRIDSAGTLIWEKSIDTGNISASSISQTSDGGYIVAGSKCTDAYSCYSDFKVMKIDSSFNLTWTKSFGGEMCNDSGIDAQQTADGGFVATGWTACKGSGAEDIWVIRLDSSGNTTWDKTFGGTDRDFGGAIKQTSDGGFIVAGDTHSYASGNPDIWVIKLDSSGNQSWAKVLGASVGTENASGILETSDGKYIVSGSTTSYGADGEEYSGNLWVVKLDSSGNQIWACAYGDTLNGNWLSSLRQTVDGGYIVSGNTTYLQGGTGTLLSDAFLVKIDSSGTQEWSKTYSGSNYDDVRSILQASDSGYLAIGYTNTWGAGGYDFWALKLDDSGNCPGCF